MDLRFFRRRVVGFSKSFAQLLMKIWKYTPIVTLLAIIGNIVIYLKIFEQNTFSMSKIIGQLWIYMKMIPFLPWIYNTPSACVTLYKIAFEKDYIKIVTSQIEHISDWHLYYSMISFMNKGRSLEHKFGTIKYTLLLILFTCFTGLAYVGLSLALLLLTKDPSFIFECSAGFSGVILALKVLTTYYWPDEGERTWFLMGQPLFSTPYVNYKYAVWIELCLFHPISPKVSFIAYLAGILVGLTFIALKLVWDKLDLIYYGIVTVVLRIGGYLTTLFLQIRSFCKPPSSKGSTVSHQTNDAPESLKDQILRVARNLKSFGRQPLATCNYGQQTSQQSSPLQSSSSSDDDE